MYITLFSYISYTNWYRLVYTLYNTLTYTL